MKKGEATAEQTVKVVMHDYMTKIWIPGRKANFIIETAHAKLLYMALGKAMGSTEE